MSVSVLDEDGERPMTKDDVIAIESDPTPCRVLEVYHNPPARLLAITVGIPNSLPGSDAVLRSTERHPFFVPSRGWIEARDLSPGDVLKTHGGGNVKVRTVHVQRNAAQHLNEGEQVQLLAVMRARLPGKWDEATAADMFLLRIIGDEATAQALEKMYSIVPTGKIVWDEGMPEVLHDTVAMIRNRLQTHAFQIAEDPLADPLVRGDAASRLDEVERMRMKSLALKWLIIPGRSNAAVEGDLVVLSVIGDEEAARKIETIYKNPDYNGGYLATLMDDAVRSIRERLSATTRSSLEQSR